MLDFSVIVEECGVGKESPPNVIKNIAKLEEFYDKSEVVEIYNYLLLNLSEAEILINVIRLSDSYKSSSTLSILLDLLLLKTNNISDSDALINVRVMCAKEILEMGYPYLSQNTHLPRDTRGVAPRINRYILSDSSHKPPSEKI